ncbi:MAG: hypothetical protein JWQ95_1824 [Sphaerisporangium sp.]|nr:hypothetical protein [Sphaerisporangium sp.]
MRRLTGSVKTQIAETPRAGWTTRVHPAVTLDRPRGASEAAPHARLMVPVAQEAHQHG